MKLIRTVLWGVLAGSAIALAVDIGGVLPVIPLVAAAVLLARRSADIEGRCPYCMSPEGFETTVVPTRSTFCVRCGRLLPDSHTAAGQGEN